MLSELILMCTFAVVVVCMCFPYQRGGSWIERERVGLIILSDMLLFLFLTLRCP
ncbi:hypothetical protein F5X96DRAFT_662420 [Biscogniauxia mediterranea]|nr:hypothetical protein F5X96DRAFT_662420 [Biscogniauxia mediterranea]